VLAPLQPSVLRDELIQRVAGALELSEARLAPLLTGGDEPAPGAGNPVGAGFGNGAAPRPPGSETAGDGRPANGSRRPVDPCGPGRAAFLAMCLAAPEAGERALSGVEPDEMFTSQLFRRVARHLRGRTESPLADLPGGRRRAGQSRGDLVNRAGRGAEVTADQLEHSGCCWSWPAGPAIIRARAEHKPGIRELARQRQEVRDAIGAVVSRIEKPV